MNLTCPYRTVLVKLPHDLSNERYSTLMHGFFSLLVLADLAARSSLVTDDLVSDYDLNAAFDQIEDYPWAPDVWGIDAT